jgi:hypothetical protein
MSVVSKLDGPMVKNGDGRKASSDEFVDEVPAIV